MCIILLPSEWEEVEGVVGRVSTTVTERHGCHLAPMVFEAGTVPSSL